MLFSNKSLVRLVSAAAFMLFYVGNSSAQTDVNKVVVAQTSGSSMYISVDHSALSLFNDSTIARLNPDGDGEWNTWKDALTNGNSPGMDVNFDSNAAYGLTNVDGSGDLTLGTITMTGFIIDGVGNATTASLNNSNGGITNAGSIAGATTINASGAITGGSLTDGSATLASGALSGATNIDGSGDLTMGTVTMTGFSVDADGDVVSKSLDNTSGGITNAGAISGATTVTASGTVQAEQLTSTDDLTVADVANIDGTLDLATGSITDQTGAISFGDDNLSTTGDLDISSGTLTLADDQISGDKVSGGTIGTVTISQLAGAMDANSQAMTNVNIDSGNIDGTAIGSTTPSTISATTIEASQDATFNGTNHLIYGETSIHNNLSVLDNTTGTTTQFSVDEATGNTTIAGTLTVAGAIDANNDLDLDGTDVDIDATNDISLDAGAASNFSTSDGALTLEGAGGVIVNATNGSLTLNGAGQTVDLDAVFIDVDATTITVDATTTTFSGNVEGPNATADNQFTTYYQLDSLANRAPFNETLRRFRLGTSQSITTGAGATRVALSGSGIYTESSDPVENPVDPLNPPMSVQSTGGQHIDLSDPGIYQVMLTMELSNSNVSDALALVEIYNYDALQDVFPDLRVLAADTEEVYGTGNAFTGVNSHLNLSMTFKADNSNEDIYIQITTYGADIDIEGYGFTVSRIGEEEGAILGP